MSDDISAPGRDATRIASAIAPLVRSHGLSRRRHGIVALVARAIPIGERRVTAAGIAEAAGSMPRLGMLLTLSSGQPPGSAL